MIGCGFGYFGVDWLGVCFWGVLCVVLWESLLVFL